MLSDWHSNEQGESAEDYYRPLEDALESYAEALKEDPSCYLALWDALQRVEELRTEATYWRDDEGEIIDNQPNRRSAVPWRNPVATSDVDTRSIFDDVDE